MTFGYEMVIDVSVILTMVTAILIGLKNLYDMKREQDRHRRVLFGDSDDETRPGVVLRERQTREGIEKQIDELEVRMEEKFDTLEEHMDYRHREIAIALREIMNHMDDPPDELHVRGPYDTREEFDD